jgi:hypothetical protein
MRPGRHMFRVTMRSSLIAVGLLACVASASARADGDPNGVVVVTGKATTRERAIIQTGIAIALRKASWSLSNPTFSPKEIEAIAKCLQDDKPWRCLRPLMDPKGVDHLVVADVNPQPDSAAKLAITGELVVAGDSGPSVVQQHCDNCDEPLLTTSAQRLVEQLLHNVAVRDEKTMLQLQTVPPGATVVLDDQPIGTTSTAGKLSRETYPGPHKLAVQHPGYVADERLVDLAAGKATPVVVELKRSDAKTERSLLVPGIVAAAGLTAIVVGTIVSATAEDSPTGPKQKYVYSGPGIGVAVAGGVAIGVAVYLWRRNVNAASTPTASLLPGGGTVGWAASF